MRRAPLWVAAALFVCACGSSQKQSQLAATDGAVADNSIMTDVVASDSLASDGDSNAAAKAASTGGSLGSSGDGAPHDGASADVRPDAGSADAKGQNFPAPPKGGPPYPIVFAHGLFGFDKIGPVDYWWKVLPALQGDGHKVYAAKMDPANSSTVRGKQLLAFVQKVLQQTGASKVNIIGHSQGGFEARYVAAVKPGLVASVVTIGTPHRGTKLADMILSQVKPQQVALINSFFVLLGRAFFGDIAKHSDVKAAAEQLSTAGASAFNKRFPDNAKVTYFSIGGWTGLFATKPALCQATNSPAFITRYAQYKDTPDLNMILTGLILGTTPNDGIVELSSTRWGRWLGCVPADHMDQVGQMLGDPPGPGNGFNHVELYRGLATFLSQQGF